MLKQVLSSGNIFVDESPINVQAARKVEKSYMWVIVGGNESSPPYRIYGFYKDRSHDNILKRLKNYQGFIHSDKYAAYEKLSKISGIIWGPCWALFF